MIKVTSKILMLVLLVLSFSLPLANTTYAMSQISLQNNTDFWLYLYIDGNFGCGPVMPSGFCISSVTPGSHVLDARKKGESGIVIMSEAVNIGDGTSPTWTVTIENSDQALLKKLDGARYVNQRAWPKIRAEYELNIRRTTLVWRMRFTWATPEIVDARVGTWREIDQMQIVGREAHSSQQSDVIFSISEDGNNITEKNGSDTYMYYRQ
jgi:hypothetical protein